MDLLVLRRLLAELQPVYQGRRIDRVYAVPPRDVALVVGASGAPRLWFSGEPDDPHLYERLGGHTTPERPPGFAMAVRKHAGGRFVAALRLVGNDRVAELAWRGSSSGRLVFELIPRRATVVLLDADDVVRAVWHRRRGRPEAGEDYEPPSPPPGRPPADLGAGDWDRLAARGDPSEVTRGLLRQLRGLSGLVAREAARRHASGTPLAEAVEIELRRAAEEDTAARIYSPRPLEQLEPESAEERSADFFLAPYALSSADDLVTTRFASLRQAASVYYPLRAHLRGLADARRKIESAVASARQRLERARSQVSEGGPDSDAEETFRRWGDLLLAQPDAEVCDGRAQVTDHYSGGEPLEIPVDPRMDLVDNAQAYYKKARRAQRTRERSAERLAALQRKEDLLAEIDRQLPGTDSVERLQELGTAAERLGGRVRGDVAAEPEALSPGAADPEAPGAGESADATAASPDPGDEGGFERQVAPGVVAFASSDGLDILVGRNARANDRLTHEIAARDDWWLHAEGPGSHVVVRNPERRDEPPADTLREAAALAAWFSFARDATKVNVRWTRVRYLKRPPGAPPGVVTMERESTVLAEPVSPEELLGA